MAPRARQLGAAVVFVMMIGLARAPQAQAQSHRWPSLSRSIDSTLNDSLASAANEDQAASRTNVVVPQHARLSPYEQCGGVQGLCNTTTIGVPCGDNPWDPESMPCPVGYTCMRQTASYWECTPVLGKKDPDNDGPTSFTTAPAGSQPAAAPRDRTPPRANNQSSAFKAVFRLPADAPGGDKNSTPEVKACPPGEISVGDRCFKGTRASSSGGSRCLPAGMVAGNVLLLAAWQLAAVLLMSAAALH